MKKFLCLLVFLVLFIPPAAFADDIADTIKMFKEAGASAQFFRSSYGYAVFPTVGKAGFMLGGSHGKGKVFERGKYIGDATMTQLSVGLQMGGQAFSQIIFFQDKRALQEFISGNFEFGAQAEAVALTSGVSASATTAGSSATASGGKNNASTIGNKYNKGMMVFVIAKGGLMYEASIGGQKFTFTPKN